MALLQVVKMVFGTNFDLCADDVINVHEHRNSICEANNVTSNKLVQNFICTSIAECFDKLEKEGCRPSELVAAVAYVKLSGVEELERLLKRYGVTKLKIITSLDFYLTEPKALKRLIDMNAEVWVYTSDREFHPKVYLVKCVNGMNAVIVGSSNLSRGAITGENIEINVVIFDNKLATRIDDLIKELKMCSKKAIDILEHYEQRYKEVEERYNEFKIFIEKYRSLLAYEATATSSRAKEKQTRQENRVIPSEEQYYYSKEMQPLREKTSVNESMSLVVEIHKLKSTTQETESINIEHSEAKHQKIKAHFTTPSVEEVTRTELKEKMEKFLSYETVWKITNKKRKSRRRLEILFDVLAYKGDTLQYKIKNQLSKDKVLVEWKIPKGTNEIIRVVYYRSKRGKHNVIRVYKCRVKEKDGTASLWCELIWDREFRRRRVLSLQDIEDIAKTFSVG